MRNEMNYKNENKENMDKNSKNREYVKDEKRKWRKKNKVFPFFSLLFPMDRKSANGHHNLYM